ncbi:MAG: hypothetical protein BMS9Abin05_0125 [Rhodothermia bacterium]|nr:MAG: hypothetical protein BMS9Abin05_0125 [Rhodothermia bacterium]
MKYSNRSKVQFLIAVILLIPIAVSGCILVVEEDYDRRDHLRGTNWYLEIVFYGVRTIAAPEQGVELSFVDENRIEGVSQCGPFNGVYSLNDRDELSIDSFSSDGGICESDEASSLFLSQLPRAKQLIREDESLRINTGRGNYLMFLEK